MSQESLKKTVEVTTEISDLLCLTHEQTQDRALFTVEVTQNLDGENPFRTIEDDRGNQIAAEFYMCPKTAVRLAHAILRAQGYVVKRRIQAKAFDPKADVEGTPV